MKLLARSPAVLLILLCACRGGGGSGSTGSTASDSGLLGSDTAVMETATSKTIGSAAAARFLARASFGGTQAEINSLAAQTSYDKWFATQAAATPCSELSRVDAQTAQGYTLSQAARVEAWWYCAVQGSDQLRQRMAFALSQILVVSDQSTLAGQPRALAYYYDILSRNALGNYRTLLGEVARAPAMGWYLNMFGSRKADPSKNIRADENFSRELMQLFTVGLIKLQANGAAQTDGSGATIPTYTQTQVEQQANALTGWGWPGGTFIWGTAQWTAPMQATASMHDVSAKTIIDNVSIAAGQSADAELNRVLDTLFNHANTAPFISRQLIQRLVSSNPSPAYVARVAAVFNNNGSGVRGDLLAVAKAILLDSEALGSSGYGKVREPLIRLAQMWRLFQASAGNGRYDFPYPEAAFAQAPLRSPSVFNFYRPDYSPPGALANAGLVAPELQILDESTVNNGGTALYYFAIRYRASKNSTVSDSTTVSLDLRPWETLASSPVNLVAQLDLYLNNSSTSPTVQKKLSTYLATIPATQPEVRVFEALDLLMHLPQSYVQR